MKAGSVLPQKVFDNRTGVGNLFLEGYDEQSCNGPQPYGASSGLHSVLLARFPHPSGGRGKQRTRRKRP